MNDSLTADPSAPVLVVGGYGTVGSRLARLVAPQHPLVLAGRTPANGAELAAELGAEARRWDLADPAPFSGSARAVVSVVNDPDDRVLAAAVRGGVPYVDITRWTTRMLRAATTASLLRPTAPVVLSSSWMGGVVSIVAADLVAELRTSGAIGPITGVDIAIRYDVEDLSGADSIEFIDRFGLDYEVRRDGAPTTVAPLTDLRRVDIGGHRTKVGRLDTPEQVTLPLTIDVPSVATRIGFSSTSATSALLVAKRAGLFRWGRGDRWRSTRRSLLASRGDGGTAMIRIDVTGRSGTASRLITDPAGQAHLTAVGGLLALEQALDGGSTGGITFPESRHDVAEAIASMAAHGVEVVDA